MLKKFTATALIPWTFAIICAISCVKTGNVVLGALALLFGSASVYYTWKAFRPGQAEQGPPAELPAVRTCNYSDGHLVKQYACTLFSLERRDGCGTSVDVDVSSGRLYRVTRDAAGKIADSAPVPYEQLRSIPGAGRFRDMTEENWESYLPKDQRLRRQAMKKPLEIPAAYCSYRSRNPVTKFYYAVSMPDRNVIVYFRSTADGCRVFQAHACEPGLASSLLSENGDPDTIMEEILAGGYQNKHFDACDRRLSAEEAACVQHLFDHEASSYPCQTKDRFANSYICRKKSRRITSGSRYAFFMQYVLQAIASRGTVVTTRAEEIAFDSAKAGDTAAPKMDSI